MSDEVESRRQYLLSSRGEIISSREHVAAQDGMVQAQQLPRMNDQDTNTNYLIFAVKCGDAELVRSLLEDEPDTSVNVQDTYGYTPLHWACQKGYLTIANILMANGASISQRDRWDRLALHRAAKEGHVEICKALLDHGTEVNARGDSNWGPLHCATFHGRKAVVELLLNHGADKLAVDNSGRTAEQLLEFSLLSEETKREIRGLVHIVSAEGASMCEEDCKKGADCIFIPDPDNPDVNLYLEVRGLKRRIKDLIMVRAELSTRQQQLENILADKQSNEVKLITSLKTINTQLERHREREAALTSKVLNRDKEIGILRAQVVSLQHRQTQSQPPHRQQSWQQPEQTQPPNINDTTQIESAETCSSGGVDSIGEDIERSRMEEG